MARGEASILDNRPFIRVLVGTGGGGILRDDGVHNPVGSIRLEDLALWVEKCPCAFLKGPQSGVEAITRHMLPSLHR